MKKRRTTHIHPQLYKPPPPALQPPGHHLPNPRVPTPVGLVCHFRPFEPPRSAWDGPRGRARNRSTWAAPSCPTTPGRCGTSPRVQTGKRRYGGRPCWLLGRWGRGSHFLGVGCHVVAVVVGGGGTEGRLWPLQQVRFRDDSQMEAIQCDRFKTTSKIPAASWAAVKTCKNHIGHKPKLAASNLDVTE